MTSYQERSTEVARADDSSLARIADQNHDAFSELYRRHLCSVFDFVKAQTNDTNTAEDITAQVFFKALRSASTYNGSGSYSAWLYQIARNSVATWMRTKERDIPVPEIPDPVDPAPSPTAQLINKESLATVSATLAELPAAQRHAIVLRYMSEVPIDQIAELTGRTPGAVRILLHRARSNLRKAYERKVG